MSDPEIPEFPPMETPPGGDPSPNSDALAANTQYDTIHGERLWGMLAYMLTFVGAIIPPIVLYAVKRDQSRFVAYHALQSLFLGLASLTLMILVMHVLPRVFEPLAAILWIGNMVYTILAAVKAYDGEWYRIPIIGDWAAAQVGAPK
jgi:uncharacterized membrane protein